MSKKIITGVKPTGASMHLGNLMGAVLPAREASRGHDAAIFIADLHALTSVKDGDTLREQSYELAAEYLAIYGVDTPVKIFRQSDIHSISKLMWILCNVTPYSLMLRAHSFKDYIGKQYEFEEIYWKDLWRLVPEIHSESPERLLELYTGVMKVIRGHSNYISDEEEKRLNDTFKHSYKGKSPEDFSLTFNMGVFNYPILMTADILGYGIEAVPVGKDQVQHLEMARDIARAFNKTYQTDLLIEPQAIVTEGLATLPGVDGRKMSKSYGNFIGVFDDEKTLKKRVMSIVTDSLGVDDVKDPESCNVFALINVFATPERREAIRAKYLTPNAGYGYGHAKLELLEILTEYLRPYRESREEILKHPEIIEQKLLAGAQVMNDRLDMIMTEVTKLTGIK